MLAMVLPRVVRELGWADDDGDAGSAGLSGRALGEPTVEEVTAAEALGA